MILERTIAPVFAANCYVLAPGADRPALVVDPGAGAGRGALWIAGRAERRAWPPWGRLPFPRRSSWRGRPS